MKVEIFGKRRPKNDRSIAAVTNYGHFPHAHAAAFHQKATVIAGGQSSRDPRVNSTTSSLGILME